MGAIKVPRSQGFGPGRIIEYDHVASMYLYYIFSTHALLAVCTIYVIAAARGV